MNWIAENYMAMIFLVTTAMSLIIAVLNHIGKKKTAAKVQAFKDILHQTFGNVESLKVKWKESGLEDKYGRIGSIFAEINKQSDIAEVLRKAYEEWAKQQGIKVK